MKYKYKFVKVPMRRGFKKKLGETFERCKEVITEEAESGWRLKQVVMPANEYTGIAGVHSYQIIFEKAVERPRDPAA